MRHTALAILVLAMVPAVAGAQDSNNRWSEIQRLTEGKNVKVTAGKDTHIAGTFLKASGDSLILRRRGAETTLDRTAIRTIKVFSPAKRDRSMIIFGAIGAVAGAVPGALLDTIANNETGNGGMAAPLFGALGAGIGILATRHSGYTTVYSAGRSSVAPLSSVAGFEQLDHRIASGDKVYVTSSEGAKVAGTVDTLSPALLAIRAGGKRYEFRADEVKSVSQRLPDSLVNGTMWGMLVGAGLAVGGTATQAGHRGYGSHSGDYLASAAVGGGIGAAAGAVIDALHKGKKVVYSRPSAPKATSLLRSLNFAPVISKNQKGAAMSFSF